jgi:diguanylate cyclase (GGDEF)-like protein/PAS domain S-box-containing protein
MNSDIRSFQSDISVKKLKELFRETNWFFDQSQKIARIGTYVYFIVENTWISSETMDGIFGIDAEHEINIENWLDLVCSEHKDRMKEYFTYEVLVNKQPFDMEYQIQKISSGEKIWVHGRGLVYYDNAGNPIYMIGTIQDINEIKILTESRTQAEKDLFEEKERLKTTFESIGDGVVTTDINGNITSMNRVAQELSGWKSKDATGKAFEDVFYLKNEITNKKIDNPISAVLGNDKTHKLGNNTMLVSKSGHQYSIADSAAPIKDSNGKTNGVVLVFRDVTDRKEAEKQLKQSFEIIETMQTGFYLYRLEDYNDDRTLRLISANIASSKLLGIERKKILGKFIDEIFPKLREKGIPQKFANVIKTGEPIEMDDFNYDDENILNSYFTFKVFRIQDDCACVLFENITEKVRYSNEVQYLSFHDSLTGLYNRAYFMNKINDYELTKTIPVSIIMGDVNGLKLTNDVYGHQAGDNLLVNIARILQETCPDNSIISRLGGDEFTVLLPDTPYEEALEVMERIKENCATRYFEPISLSISLGVSTKTDTSSSINEILFEAENRMYANKLAEGKSLRNSIISTLQTTLSEKSFETEGHSERMTELVKLIGKRIQLTHYETKEMRLLSLLHDIGKIGIADIILNKSELLNADDWLEIKKHPLIGYRIAQATPELSHISDLILSHHEHWDGTGYPQGLRGEEIPKLSRIMAIVDAYDVMTNERPYRKPLSKEAALAEIRRCSGTQFDPFLVEEFLEIMK